MQSVFKGKPSRLDLIFQRFGAPVYFVTFNTHIRASLLATPQVHAAFIEYCRSAADFRIGVGRYVLVPDHIHLFVCFGIGCSTTLSTWIKGTQTGTRSHFALKRTSTCKASGPNAIFLLATGLSRSSVAKRRELCCQVGLCVQESGARWTGYSRRRLAIRR